MGLALIIVILKTIALRTGDAHYHRAARFWGKLFAINFTMGVVTGIPMEFQFGTNWSEFARASGGVIGQTLAMEGVFAFFLESTFLGLFLFGEKRLGPKLHWLSAFCVFLGSWVSGYFIVATNAWMQHPVGYEAAADGSFLLSSLSALFANPWLVWQYPHVMLGSLTTSSIVVAAVGAWMLIAERHQAYGRTFVRMGVVIGLGAAVLTAFPTGDRQALNTARYKPVGFAAMEGLFDTEAGAPLAIVGQPNMESETLDNPIVMPKMLSFLTYKRLDAEVHGLNEFPRDQWPQNVPLLYYAYHVMVGLGTIFVAVLGLSALWLWRRRLYTSRPLLWALMLMLPFPYIANTAGWMTAELGRQPWVIQGLMRTADGASPAVSAGNSTFTLIGFMGLYALLSVLFLFLMAREIQHGPEGAAGGEA
jgi:cytochrome d ubiquinol oxidase subunit I